MNYKVICLDNLITGSKNNIVNLFNEDNFEFIEHDINYKINLNVDYIFNLACPASPIKYKKNPVETIRTNVLGSLNILEIARRNNARILQASTSEIYGDPMVHPQSEDYWGNVNPIGPRACYDEGKRAAETLFYDYNREYGIEIRVARIFNTYGPKMAFDDGRVVSNFITQSLSNNSISIYGDGKQTRSFCYIDDLIDALIILMFHSNRILPINLGNPQEVSILDLAKLVSKLANSKSKVVFLEKPLDDPIRRKPNITIAEKELNWYPKTPLKKGLLNSIDYFKRELI